MKQETKFPWWGWPLVAGLLPVIYVLSVFPVGLALQQFGREFPDGFQTFYTPLKWAVEEWEWFADAMNSIAERVITP